VPDDLHPRVRGRVAFAIILGLFFFLLLQGVVVTHDCVLAVRAEVVRLLGAGDLDDEGLRGCGSTPLAALGCREKAVADEAVDTQGLARCHGADEDLASRATAVPVDGQGRRREPVAQRDLGGVAAPAALRVGGGGAVDADLDIGGPCNDEEKEAEDRAEDQHLVRSMCECAGGDGRATG